MRMVQDITPRETVRERPKCDRDVTIYGYLRGTNLKPGGHGCQACSGHGHGGSAKQAELQLVVYKSLLFTSHRC